MEEGRREREVEQKEREGGGKEKGTERGSLEGEKERKTKRA